MDEIERGIAEAVVELAAPLVPASSSSAAARQFLAALGWDVTTVADLGPVVGALAGVGGAVTAAAGRLADQNATALDHARSVVELGAAIATSRTALAAWRPPNLSSADAAALAEELSADVLAGLADMWLRRRAPRVRAALLAAGVLRLEATTAVSLRPAGTRLAVDFAQLGRWVTAPDAAFRQAVVSRSGSGLAWDAAVLAAWPVVGPALADALLAAGRPAAWRPADASAPASLWVFTSEEMAGIGSANPAGWMALAVEVVNGSVALHVVPRGTLGRAYAGRVWTVNASVQGASEVTVTSASVAGSAAVIAEVQAVSSVAPAMVLGPANGPHVEVAAVQARLVTTLTPWQAPALRLDLALTGVTVGLGAGGTDNFVARFLGSGTTAAVDVAASWTPEDGLRVSAGLDRLTVLLAEQVELGPVAVRRLTLALAPAADAVGLALTGDLAGNLGPVAFTVERLGAQLRLGPGPGALGMGSAHVGALAPKGVGLRVGAGPVRGGGYLFFDAESGEYGGAVELSVGVLSLKAIGLLSTRLPGAGFSLLVIITAEFPPIQLGFGFSLLGVGGLLGVNRTLALPALREGVRTGALGSILFPQDPVANAAQMLAVLRTVFPPAEGRYTFGPMVKLGWGPNQLLQLEVALVLELPSPLRLVVLGRVSAVLPDRAAAVAVIRLDVVGILDFGERTVSVDASLVDSHVASFPISGDMALRGSFGARPGFALAAGGFHPRFAPPPGFPSLRRLAIALASGQNPRLRLEAYFALTPNSVQFGARLDVFVASGGFSAVGKGTFDALVNFEPFRVLVQTTVSLAVAYNGNPLLQGRLEANVEGPTPWHAWGFFEFEILFLKGRVTVDITAGEERRDEPARVDLRPVVREALLADDAWTGELPGGATAGASLRALAPAEGIVVHPLGRFTVRQRAVPFDTPLSRYGAARLAPGTPGQFSLIGIGVGTAWVSNPPSTIDAFPSGQFADLTDDQKISRPGFEQLPSGGRGVTAQFRWPVVNQAPVAVKVELKYDEAVIDAPPGQAPQRRTNTRKTVALESVLIEPAARSGAAARSAARQRDDVSGPERKVEVVGERYVVAAKDSLPAAAQAAGGRAYAQAAATRGSGQLVTVGELA